MTAAFLQSALAALITDSKKKSNDVRAAAEKSLGDLKSIAVTSETQLAGDLAKRPDFIDPFVLASQTKHAKLAVPGVACLQRLVASRAVPRTRLNDVLNACWEAVDLNYEVQLKILQTLPALLQLYGDDLHDGLLARVLDICATLHASRTPLVANSAGATLDQLVESIFEQAEVASRSSRRKGSEDVEIRDDSNNDAALITDACRLFKDFCTLLNRGQPDFLTTDSLTPIYLLRVLEKVLESHGNFIRGSGELVEASRTEILPAIEHLLSGKDDFLIVAHCTRLTYILLQRLSAHLVQDATPVLKLFLVFADRDGGPLWKRSLSLELFRSLLTNFGLLMRIFEPSQKETDNIIASLMAALVRIAAEDPTLIGMGRQSTMPVQGGNEAAEDEMASIEAQGIGGGGFASVSSAEAGATGIGLDFSTLERPLIDTEESGGPSNIPKTYIYTLLLGSISALCEGLSKFIMPLSVTSRHSEPQPEEGEDETEDDTAAQPRTRKRDLPGHKYQRLANPLKMTQLPQLVQVQTCARMIDQCWPAILATSSTFLNAALDSHFYHVLIRSMQKLAQVSGTLELSTPRDALLTSLAKGSVPANAASIIALSQPVTYAESTGADETVGEGLRSPGTDGLRQSIDVRKQSLNIRHLLCLRALLNLGIALGPTLGQEAWFIFIETLQQVEALMSISVGGTTPVSTAVPRSDGAQDGQATLATEIAAVNTASRRMLDSTRSYTDDSFTAVVTALFRLMGETPTNGTTIQDGEQLNSPAAPTPTKIRTPGGHRTSRSVSGMWVKTKALDIEVAFVLAKAKDLSRINLYRFASSDPRAWDLVADRLLQVSQDQDLSPKLRLEAAEILGLICMESVKLLDEASPSDAQVVQSKALTLLHSQMSLSSDITSPSRPQQLQLEIGQRVFEALEDILGHCGDSLDAGWPAVFAILEAGVHHGTMAPAFRCVQLICNDFMTALSPGALESLVALMLHFGGQEDTNMALTTATLLRNIASLLQERADALDLSEPTEGARLWLSTIQQLSKLCASPRRDVRDASVRILIQALDGSGDLLTSPSWSKILDTTFVSLAKRYLQEMDGEEAGVWETTCVYLTEASTTLIKDHVSSIAIDPKFQETWNKILDVFEAEIQYPTFGMYTVGFSSISVLLEAISALKIDHEPLVSAAMVLWAKNTSALSNEHPEVSVPNQAALAAHASMFQTATSTSPRAVQSFRHKDNGIAPLLQKSIQRSLLESRHPPYTSDVRKLAVDQELNLNCITILLKFMEDTMGDFVSFLFQLLESMHGFGVQSNVVEQPAASKKWQKPTFMAISSAILGILCQIVEDHSIACFDHLQAFRLLTAIISFKYTTAPTNSDAPLWKDAATTAAVLLEALRGEPAPKNSDLVAKSVIALLSTILGAGGLVDAKSPPSPDALLRDEDFDISHFTRIHAASIPFICLPSTAEDTRKEYVLTIFHASILAKPWFDDFPDHDDLLSTPLKDINTLRRGSVHTPIFPQRRKVVYAALDALFDLSNPASSSITYNPTIAR